MKKFLEEKHDLLAGLLAALAFAAIICEMALGGFTKENFVSGIKDMSGILIDVLVLMVAASVLLHKPVNFKQKFSEAMENIKKKYSPLLSEDPKEGTIRYNIASNPDALFSEPAKSPERIFELDETEPDQICFYVNKSFFSYKGAKDYDPKGIANEIIRRLMSVYKDYDITPFPNGANYGIRIDFKQKLSSEEDINKLISLIDYSLFLFVAKNKS